MFHLFSVYLNMLRLVFFSAVEITLLSHLLFVFTLVQPSHRSTICHKNPNKLLSHKLYRILEQRQNEQNPATFAVKELTFAVKKNWSLNVVAPHNGKTNDIMGWSWKQVIRAIKQEIKYKGANIFFFFAEYTKLAATIQQRRCSPPLVTEL